MTKIVQIPKNYRIVTPFSGEIIPHDKRVLLSLSYWGDLFGETGAEISIFEPILNPPLRAITKFGGLWEVYIDDVLRFRGFLSNMTKERARGGNIFTFNLRSVLSAWDVLLTNTTFGVTGSGQDHIVDNMTEYLTYLINTVVPMTINSGVPNGIQFNGSIPYNNVSFSDLYEDGVLSVVNSTYLTEIQRACQALGFVVYTNPAFGDVEILDPLNPSKSYFSINDDEKISASFEVDVTSIPATVLVNDDISNIGVAYGYMPTSGDKDYSNFSMSGINNIAFVTTVGMKKDALSGIAKKIFDISRKASQILTVKKAGLESVWDRRPLGKILSWTDSAGRSGEYIISYIKVDISPSEVSTSIRAFVK